MNLQTKERYEKNQKLAIMALQAIVDLLKQEKRVNLKYFKEIIEICRKQLESGGEE